MRRDCRVTTKGKRRPDADGPQKSHATPRLAAVPTTNLLGMNEIRMYQS